MATVELIDVSKRFGSVTVIEDLTLVIESREFMVFLGPSGCGKSTLLRMIAGLESVDAGKILIDGNRVDHLAPGKRGVAMVFQHYALYPHMSIRDNMAFGLRNVGMPAAEIDRRVGEAAGVLEIEELLDRRPGALSGGQRQRVAIGRAIVKEPKVFLFDEPLSNLDAALRVRTRYELAQLHQRVKATMVFVTHDQTEAMTMADRMVVMNNRIIEQVGTPIEIYARPATRFVAGFVGSPSMNFCDVVVTEAEGQTATVRLANGALVKTEIPLAALPVERTLTLGIRPEAIELSGDGDVQGAIEVIERLGDRTLVYVRLSDGSTLTAVDSGLTKVAIGDKVSLTMDGPRTHLFDSRGRGFHAAATIGQRAH